MRITDNYIYAMSEANISDGYDRTANYENQISTGIRVSEANVDPLGMAEITLLQSHLDTIQQSGENATVAQTEIQTEQTQLSSYTTILQSITQTVEKASNGTNSPDDLKGDATQLSAYLAQLVSIANAKNANGDSIFAGTNVGQDAYQITKDANGNITGVTYQGNDQQQKISLNSGVSVNIYQSGNAAFGSGSNSIFSNLISFIQRLQTGQPLTSAESTAETTALKGLSDKNTEMLTTVQNQYKLADFEVGMYTALKQNYSAQMSQVRDTDYATAVSEMMKQMTILKATMESSQQLEKLSIFNQGS